MLCLCHTTPAQKLLFACLSSGWATTPGRRLLDPRWEIALNDFPKDTATRYSIESRIKVLQLSITSPMLYHLSHAAATSLYQFYKMMLYIACIVLGGPLKSSPENVYS